MSGSPATAAQTEVPRTDPGARSGTAGPGSAQSRYYPGSAATPEDGRLTPIFPEPPESYTPCDSAASQNSPTEAPHFQ